MTDATLLQHINNLLQQILDTITAMRNELSQQR